MKTDWKDVAVRSLKTFIQSFGAALVTLLSTGGEVGAAFTKTAIISAAAAAICAVWNGVINPVLTQE